MKYVYKSSETVVDVQEVGWGVSLKRGLGTVRMLLSAGVSG